MLCETQMALRVGLNSLKNNNNFYFLKKLKTKNEN